MEIRNQMAESEAAPDLDMARLDSGSVFSSTEELLDYRGLTLDQKIEILRRWAYDVSELAIVTRSMDNAVSTATFSKYHNQLSGCHLFRCFVFIRWWLSPFIQMRGHMGRLGNRHENLF